MTREIRPCGQHAFLLTVDDPDELAGVVRALIGAPPPGVVDLVPGVETVLVVGQAGADVRALARAVRDVVPEPPAEETANVVDIDVDYDGPDLAAVANLTGLTVAEVVDAHTATAWRVALGGFLPGFAYLVGGDRRLRVRRRSTPRTSVPAGSVGLADAFSGVYPTASPGGWQLIGRTDIVLFDAAREPPALLTPGTTVRFRATK